MESFTDNNEFSIPPTTVVVVGADTCNFDYNGGGVTVPPYMDIQGSSNNPFSVIQYYDPAPAAKNSMTTAALEVVGATEKKKKKKGVVAAKGYNCNLTNIIKGQDRIMLVKLIDKFGERKWSKMAATLGKECRERWINHLQPDINKKYVWSEKEETILIENHKKVGNRWAAIARNLPGRTDNTVKNYWDANKRNYSYHKLCQTKFISKKPKSFLLNNYIKTVLSLPPPPQITPITDIDLAWGSTNNYFTHTNNESYHHDHMFDNSDSMFSGPNIDPIFGGSQQSVGCQTGYKVNDLSSNPLPEMNGLTLNDDSKRTMSST